MKKTIATIMLLTVVSTGIFAQGAGAKEAALDTETPYSITSQATIAEKASKYIGKSKAKKIALAKAKGKNARITEIELDREDGVMVYEGEMVDSKYEYDFEINAKTGKIIEWEREYRD